MLINCVCVCVSQCVFNVLMAAAAKPSVTWTHWVTSRMAQRPRAAGDGAPAAWQNESTRFSGKETCTRPQRPYETNTLPSETFHSGYLWDRVYSSVLDVSAAREQVVRHKQLNNIWKWIPANNNLNLILRLNIQLPCWNSCFICSTLFFSTYVMQTQRQLVNKIWPF